MYMIDMWYGDKVKDVDRVDYTFYPNNTEYRGNCYIKGKCVGDYVAKGSLELEKMFSHLTFIWD